MMLSSSFLTVAILTLKFLGIAISAVSGVLALLVDFKDQAGTITRWGRVAMFGVIGGALISVLTQGAEAYRSEISAEEAAAQQLEETKRNQAVLEGIERSLQPLDFADVYFDLTLPKDHSLVSPLATRIQALAAAIQAGEAPENAENNGHYVNHAAADGTPLGLAVNVKSSLWPKEIDEPELYALLSFAGVRVSFVAETNDVAAKVRQSSNASHWPSIGSFGSVGDYSFDIDNDDYDAVSLSYDFASKTLTLRLRNEPIERWIRKTGAIVSIPELIESTMLVTVDVTTVPDIDKDFPMLLSARKAIEITSISIDVSGRTFRAREEDIVSTPTGSGLKIFQFGPVGE